MHSSVFATPNVSAVAASMLGQATVVDLFQLQVRSRPFATALEVGDHALTYIALGAQVDHLAHILRAKGIGRGDVVAVCLKRTENLIVGLLATLRSGAAYLPLSPSDPTLRLGRVLSHARARFVLTDSQSMANLPQEPAQVIVLDQHPVAPDEMPGELPGAPDGTDLAYVIYTSGTTGLPKGVAVTHAALANIFNDIAQRIAFSHDSKWLAVTTVSFDIAALELLLPVCFGGKVILASEEQVRIGRVLAGIMQHKKPTVMQATPITWRILLESGWSGSPDLTILCGGDRLDRDLANRLLARSSSLWNMYGPTETTIWSTADEISSGADAVTIGRPLANTEVYLLDDEGQLQTNGNIGEICIGGAGVAREYVNDPQLTGQCFIQLNVSPSRTLRVYRTGDLGRWRENGKLEFHGRIDHQVKINGFRIELAEIECVMRTCPGVLDVAVLGVGGATNQKRLYAFVVGQNPAAITASEVVNHLSRYLPKYMVPEKFWSLNFLPSTFNGKRDVAALEAIAKVKPDLAC
jgi:iturin family lipopeptide synthetase A